MRVCSKCGKDKVNDDFYYRKDSGKYRSDCKECVKAQRSRYRKEQTEKVNASNRKSYAGSLKQRQCNVSKRDRTEKEFEEYRK